MFQHDAPWMPAAIKMAAKHDSFGTMGDFHKPKPAPAPPAAKQDAFPLVLVTALILIGLIAINT